MPNSPQPQGTHREGLGERPFSQYQITLDRAEGAPAEIGITMRLSQEKGPDKWVTSRTSADTLFTSHKLAVNELVKIHHGYTDGGTVATPEVEASDDQNLREHNEGLDRPEALATAQDGSCSRATKSGSPCKSKAGAATDHLGAGACKSHEGQPLMVLASV